MSTVKRKHETLTLSVKMEILRKLDKGEKVAEIARTHNIPRTTIYSIKSSRENIEKFVKDAEAGSSSRQTVKAGEFSKMEEALYSWFIKERARHTPINAELLKEKSLTFYNKIYGKDDFKASDGWFTKFKVRYGIRLLTVTGEKLSSDDAAVDPFIKRFLKHVDEVGLTGDQVYNADESGLFWKLFPRKSYVHQNEASAPGFKVPKDRVTILPCSNATGTHKLKLLVLGKVKNPRPFKNVNLPVTYKCQNKAWMTKEIFHEWFHTEFVPQVHWFLQKRNLPEKALLVLDNAPGHGPNDVLMSKDGRIKTLFMPPNCTPLLQPMDQNIIQMVKKRYKKKILLEAVSRNDDITATLKSINLKDAVFMVAAVWDTVPQSAIRSSWKKLWPSLDSPEEGQDSFDPEDLIPLADLIESALKQAQDTELQRVDIQNWCDENIDFQEAMTEDEIIAELDSSNREVSEDSFEVLPKTTVKTEDALSAIETCIKWGEENSAATGSLTALRK